MWRLLLVIVPALCFAQGPTIFEDGEFSVLYPSQLSHIGKPVAETLNAWWKQEASTFCYGTRIVLIKPSTKQDEVVLDITTMVITPKPNLRPVIQYTLTVNTVDGSTALSKKLKEALRNQNDTLLRVSPRLTQVTSH